MITFPVDEYEPLYFTDNKSLVRGILIPRSKQTHKKVEKRIESILENRIINKEAIAWKWGQLKYNKSKKEIYVSEKNGSIFNGYKNISVDAFGRLVDALENKQDSIKDKIKEGDLEGAFVEIRDNAPPNSFFGTVNIINVMYFLSGKKIPIFDRYAYRAAKALVLKKNPYEVFVGQAPEAKYSRESINMLNEYMELLECVFETYEIERKQDRALWVYGHLEKEY